MMGSHAPEPMEGRLTECEAAEKFMLAGNATVTIMSNKTQTRFTYKIKKPDDWKPERPVWFVSVLTGPDNDADFQYLGSIIRKDARYLLKATKGSKIAESAPSFIAFAWTWSRVTNLEVLPESVELWHAGRCGRCGRKLTVPESIESGFGPECINYV